MPTPRAEIIGRCVKEPYKGTDKKGKPYIFVRTATSDSHKEGEQWVTDRQLFIDVQLFDADPNMRIPRWATRCGRSARSTRTCGSTRGRPTRTFCAAPSSSSRTRSGSSLVAAPAGVVSPSSRSSRGSRRTVMTRGVRHRRSATTAASHRSKETP